MATDDLQAGRVILNPVGAGCAEVLVVDECPGAAALVHPAEQPANVNRVVAADQEARNLERIAAIGPYEMQDLAAGILSALGYETEAAPPGADGGIDIRACNNALLLQPPIVKAQVNARPGSKTGPDEIRQLNGLLECGTDRGIFVSTGGFTAPAAKEAESMQIQLWDLDCVAELFLEHYEELPETTSDLVPLRRIWVLDD